MVRGGSSASPDALAALVGFLDLISRDIAIVLGEGLRDVGRDSFAAEPLARGIVGFVQAAGDWWLERGAIPRGRLVDELTALLWGGLSGMGLGGTQNDSNVRLTDGGTA